MLLGQLTQVFFQIELAVWFCLCVSVIFTVKLTAFQFQENILKTTLQLEDTFFSLAETWHQNCLVVCDRGIMDPVACEYFF